MFYVWHWGSDSVNQTTSPLFHIVILSTKQNIGKDTIGEFDVLKPSILSFIFKIIFFVKYVFAEQHTSQFQELYSCTGALHIYQVFKSALSIFTRLLARPIWDLPNIELGEIREGF